MTKKRTILSLTLSLLAAQVLSAAPLGSDLSIPHTDGWDGKLPGVKSWMLMDGTYGSKANFCFYGIAATPRGDVYISAEDHLTNSGLYKLDNRTDRLWFLGDARSASLEVNNWLPGETCEKFHAKPIYINGRTYVASADYSPEDGGYVNRRGSHLYTYDEYMNKFMDLSVTEPNGIMGKLPIFAMMADEKNGIVYGLGQPRPNLYAYDIKTGKTTDLGVPPFAPAGFYTCSRYMWQDKNSRVYFTIKPFKYICFYDPTTKEFGRDTTWKTSNQFSTNIRNGVASYDGKFHYVADYEGHLYKFSVNDITFEPVGQLTTTDTTYYKHFPAGDAFRIRAMNLSADGKKLYFLNDEATHMGFFEFDLESRTTRLICQRADLENTYNNINYTCHAGQNAWDQKGRFYISSFFGFPTPTEKVVTVIMTRIDPVRIKAALGFLPGLTEVTIDSRGANVSISRTGDVSSDLEVLLSVEENGHRHCATTASKKELRTVVIPANSNTLQMKMRDFSQENNSNKDITIKVIPNGNTYVTGCHDMISAR